ncbi:MAG: FABP family protein, partial [Actinomycetes bacterium]
MVFTIPEGLHEDLYPLAWMIGTWRGKGHGEYPGIPSFQYAQEVTFN